MKVRIKVIVTASQNILKTGYTVVFVHRGEHKSVKVRRRDHDCALAKLLTFGDLFGAGEISGNIAKFAKYFPGLSQNFT